MEAQGTSTIPAVTPTSHQLRMLLADRQLGAASKLAYLQLWELAGSQPGEIVITADWLGATCGRSPRAARLWLRELERHDLIKIGERNERRGTFCVAVFNPCPGNREATPDPQMRLPFGPSEVSEPKPPRPLYKDKESKEDLLCQSTKESKEFKEAKNSKDPRYSKGAPADVFETAAASLLQATEPAEQKARLKRRIQRACGERHPVAEWVAGAAANLVIYEGVPIEDLDRILADLDAMRCAGSLRSAGSFFHAQARRLAARAGKPWPRQSQG